MDPGLEEQQCPRKCTPHAAALQSPDAFQCFGLALWLQMPDLPSHLTTAQPCETVLCGAVRCGLFCEPNIVATQLWLKIARLSFAMLSLFDKGVQRLITSCLDRVQAYRLHHVDKHFFFLLHRLIRIHEQEWRELERIEMRFSEWERISRRPEDRVPGRVALLPPSPDGDLDSFSDISDIDGQ